MELDGNKQSKEPKRVVLLSWDAVGGEDITYLEKMPNFSAFLKNASICSNVASVYPSLTYPAHTSIITGKNPKNHGIVNNTKKQFGRKSPDWLNQRKDIKGSTLYDALTQQRGWKTASLLWPVTGRAEITYNLPEVMPNRLWQNQIMVSAWNGSLTYQLDLNRRFGHLRRGIQQPFLDDFVQASLLYTLQVYQPNLLLVHYTDVDSHRHKYGVHHPKVTEALGRMDTRLGEVMDMLEKTGNMDETTIVLLGDHYQKDTHTVIYPNYLLRKSGHLKVEGERVKAYRIIAKHADGACYLYAHPSCQKGSNVWQLLKAEAMHLATSWLKQKDLGIQCAYTAEEAERMGADAECLAMLEAKDGYYFLDAWEERQKVVEKEYKHPAYATHGYSPMKEDYQTFFAATGCGIKSGVKLQTMSLCDVGVTLAELLQVDIGIGDGSVKKEILY